MKKRDIIEEEVQKMSLFLKRMLTKILGEGFSSTESNAMEEASKDFNARFSIDLNTFVAYTPEETLQFITSHQFKDHHLENLAQILETMALKKNEYLKENYLCKAIMLLDLADQTTKSFSVERLHKKTKLRSLLN